MRFDAFAFYRTKIPSTHRMWNVYRTGQVCYSIRESCVTKHKASAEIRLAASRLSYTAGGINTFKYMWNDSDWRCFIGYETVGYKRWCHSGQKLNNLLILLNILHSEFQHITGVIHTENCLSREKWFKELQEESRWKM